MKTCKHCGQQSPDTDKYCNHCGSRFREEPIDKEEKVIEPEIVDNTTQQEKPPTPGYKEIGYLNEIRSLNFEGRLNRWRYCKYTLFNVLGFLLGCFILVFIGSLIGISQRGLTLTCYAVLLTYALVSMSFSVRRLHDLNRSGWYYLLMFAPYVSFLFWIYLLVVKGTEGPNRYGPDPLA